MFDSDCAGQLRRIDWYYIDYKCKIKDTDDPKYCIVSIDTNFRKIETFETKRKYIKDSMIRLEVVGTYGMRVDVHTPPNREGETRVFSLMTTIDTPNDTMYGEGTAPKWLLQWKDRELGKHVPANDRGSFNRLSVDGRGYW